MKNFGFVGCLLCMVGFAMFLGLIYEACWPRLTGGADFSSARIEFGRLDLEPRKALTLPLIPGMKFRSQVLEVNTNSDCKVEVHALIHSEVIKKKKKLGSDRVQYMIPYSFPLKCKIYTLKGNWIKIIDEELAYDSRSRRSPYLLRAEQKKLESVTHYCGKFRVPPPGRIRVEVEIGLDKKYGASVNAMDLVVFDNLPHYGKSVLIASILSLIGVTIIIYSFFPFKWKRSKEQTL